MTRPLTVVAAERWGIWRYSGAVAFAVGTAVWFAAVGAFHAPIVMDPWTSAPELVGSALLFCLMPAYFMACSASQDARIARAVDGLAAGFPQLDCASWLGRVRGAPRSVVWAMTVLGAVWGYLNVSELLPPVLSGAAPLQHVSILVANFLLWLVVGRTLAFRLSGAIGFRRMGAIFSDLRLPQAEAFKPLAQIATVDVLMVAGALALMPLQALDAEFRWVNYEAGLLVGLPSAALLFVLPLTGVARRIKAAKARELARVAAAIAETAETDIERLETLLAYRDRIGSTPNLPVDVRVVTRILLYGVIPPLAWVGAALVENLVEAMLR